MDKITLPANVFDPGDVLAAAGIAFYGNFNGERFVEDGQGAAAQALLAAADRRPVYRAAAKRALRQELERRMEALLDSARTRATVWDYLGMLDSRISGQTLSAAELARQTDARNIVTSVRALVAKWRQIEARLDAEVNARTIYNVEAQADAQPEWTA